MNREVISDKQGVLIVVLFIIGTNSIFVSGASAEKDIWLANIVATILGLGMGLIYARMHYIFHDKDMFDIIEICFGRHIGRFLIVLLTLFYLEQLSNSPIIVGEFIGTVSLSETPKIAIEISIMLIGVYIVKKGIEVLGRWANLFSLIYIANMFIILFLLIPIIEINNIKPILNNGLSPVFKGAFETFMFPFAQLLLLSSVFKNFRKRESPYKIYFIGVLIGGIIITSMSLVISLVLGIYETSNLYFPSYSTFARISVKGFFQRIEILSGVSFIIGIFIKVSVHLMVASKGIAKIFNCSDYRFIVFPTALLTITVAQFSYEGIMELFEYNEIWYYYALPFYVILPLITYIIAEIKKRKGLEKPRA
ncbi:endospore germination permease [Wukongibacter baidiensis]|uniref:GerAB/ArcD/ProY family transporter n=1 Tax=Wukongibacter baidiensis TaxID=1723361 RepID=UPI003D7F7BF0